MNTMLEGRRQIRFVRQGNLAAEVEVTPREDTELPAWGPYLTAEDARKLDAVRKALRASDITTARKLALRVFTLHPVAAE